MDDHSHTAFVIDLGVFRQYKTVRGNVFPLEEGAGGTFFQGHRNNCNTEHTIVHTCVLSRPDRPLPSRVVTLLSQQRWVCVGRGRWTVRCYVSEHMFNVEFRVWSCPKLVH